MRVKDAVTGTGGGGWVWVGIGVAIVIAAVSYTVVQKRVTPTEEELTALVPEEELQPEPKASEPAAQAPVEPLPQPTPAAPLPDDEEVDNVATSDADGDADDQVAEEEAAPEQVDDDGEALAQAENGDEAPAQAEDSNLDAEATTALSEADESPVVPSIDEVRLAADGVAVVAGRASPGATVEVLVDGEVVTSVQADGNGAFAAVGVFEVEPTARVLSLRSVNGSVTVGSDDEVILAPVAKPPAEAEQTEIAQAEPEPDADPVAPAVNKAAPALESADSEESIAVVGDAPQSLASSDVISEPADDSQVASDNGSGDQAAEVDQVGQSSDFSVETGTAPLAQAQAPEAPTLSETTESSQEPQIALLKSDAEGVTLLQTAPEPPARVRLDTIGYTDSGIVQLAGRASREAVEVRVYLNNRVAATLPVADAGSWRGEVPDVDAGVYTLRVDEVDAQGTVTSRLETPFKREAPEVLAAATQGLDSPAALVTVQRGDTLWAIARDRYGEGLLYVQVFQANRASIRDPDLIYPGQIFALPPD